MENFKWIIIQNSKSWVSKKAMYGLHKCTNFFSFFFTIYVSLFRARQAISSFVHVPVEGVSILHNNTITLLSCKSPKWISNDCLWVTTKSSGYISSTQSLACKGTSLPIMRPIHSITFFQNRCIFVHSHKQWINVPFSSLHSHKCQEH